MLMLDFVLFALVAVTDLMGLRIFSFASVVEADGRFNWSVPVLQCKQST
jgi:hypothetical protein